MPQVQVVEAPMAREWRVGEIGRWALMGMKGREGVGSSGANWET